MDEGSVEPIVLRVSSVYSETYFRWDPRVRRPPSLTWKSKEDHDAAGVEAVLDTLWAEARENGWAPTPPRQGDDPPPAIDTSNVDRMVKEWMKGARVDPRGRHDLTGVELHAIWLSALTDAVSHLRERKATTQDASPLPAPTDWFSAKALLLQEKCVSGRFRLGDMAALLMFLLFLHTANEMASGLSTGIIRCLKLMCHSISESATRDRFRTQKGSYRYSARLERYLGGVRDQRTVKHLGDVRQELHECLKRVAKAAPRCGLLVQHVDPYRGFRTVIGELSPDLEEGDFRQKAALTRKPVGVGESSLAILENRPLVVVDIHRALMTYDVAVDFDVGMRGVCFVPVDSEGKEPTLATDIAFLVVLFSAEPWSITTPRVSDAEAELAKTVWENLGIRDFLSDFLGRRGAVDSTALPPFAQVLEREEVSVARSDAYLSRVVEELRREVIKHNLALFSIREVITEGDAGDRWDPVARLADVDAVVDQRWRSYQDSAFDRQTADQADEHYFWLLYRSLASGKVICPTEAFERPPNQLGHGAHPAHEVIVPITIDPVRKGGRSAEPRGYVLVLGTSLRDRRTYNEPLGRFQRLMTRWLSRIHVAVEGGRLFGIAERPAAVPYPHAGLLAEDLCRHVWTVIIAPAEKSRHEGLAVRLDERAAHLAKIFSQVKPDSDASAAKGARALVGAWDALWRSINLDYVGVWTGGLVLATVTTGGSQTARLVGNVPDDIARAMSMRRIVHRFRELARILDTPPEEYRDGPGAKQDALWLQWDPTSRSVSLLDASQSLPAARRVRSAAAHPILLNLPKAFEAAMGAARSRHPSAVLVIRLGFDPLRTRVELMVSDTAAMLREGDGLADEDALREAVSRTPDAWLAELSFARMTGAVRPTLFRPYNRGVVAQGFLGQSDVADLRFSAQHWADVTRLAETIATAREAGASAGLPPAPRCAPTPEVQTVALAIDFSSVWHHGIFTGEYAQHHNVSSLAALADPAIRRKLSRELRWFERNVLTDLDAHRPDDATSPDRACPEGVSAWIGTVAALLMPQGFSNHPERILHLRAPGLRAQMRHALVLFLDVDHGARRFVATAYIARDAFQRNRSSAGAKVHEHGLVGGPLRASVEEMVKRVFNDAHNLYAYGTSNSR